MNKLKYVSFLCILSLMLGGCQKDETDFLNNPDVDIFIKMIKNGTYHVTNENGHVEIPNFQKSHIPELLTYADDLTIIPNRYPTAAASAAIGAQRVGEAVLWTIEGIRCNKKYPSYSGNLMKYEADDEKIYEHASDEDILKAALLYKLWWKEEYPFNKAHDKFIVYPLEDTPYSWN